MATKPGRMTTHNTACILAAFVAALVLVACSSPQERREMERLLAEADSMNRHYVAFTTDTALQRAVRLADRHGSNHDRVRARYLLGCAYRDMGEAPQALDCYHQAIDLADTTRADCDYLLLSKIHGQAGDLFQRQGLSRNAINEYRLGEKLAWHAKDTLTAILIHGQIGNSYFDMYDYDSVLVVSYQTRNLLLSRGDTLRGNTFLAHPISVHLAREEYSKAKPLLYLYQHKSEVADTCLNDPNYKMLYNYMGCYALGTEDYGTASRLFHQLSREDEAYLKLCGYLGLYNLYKRQGLTDSCFIFGDKYISLNDSVIRQWEQGHVQNVQGLYNYQRHRQQAEQKALEANALRYWLISVTAVLAIVVLFSISFFFLYRLYVRARMAAARNAYIMAMVEYLRLKSIILSLPTQNAYLLENLTQASTNAGRQEGTGFLGSERQIASVAPYS